MISLDIIKHDPVCVISDRMDDIYRHFCYISFTKNVLKCDMITCKSLQNIKITPKMDSPYSNTSKTWCHSCLYYFWFSSYDSGLLRKAAILDLSNSIKMSTVLRVDLNWLGYPRTFEMN